jgi:hypothetical protein
LLLLSTTACALKPVTVGVVFDDVWELGKDSLTEPEQSIVKATALRTLRQAYQGFGVFRPSGLSGICARLKV